ncbi:hypothetical protein [Bradyrhizobium genosp. A]|uniref:hypothetical protein n=1 Tax=Bradyrhizobium genosp. A TaxID=83626 RepID=UPI003CF830EB
MRLEDLLRAIGHDVGPVVQKGDVVLLGGDIRPFDNVFVGAKVLVAEKRAVCRTALIA